MQAPALGQLVLMVGEYVIHPAAVNVQLLSQEMGGHDGAFDVPTRPPLAPGGRPAAVPIAGLVALPEGKVPGLLLGIIVSSHPLPHHHLLRVQAGQAAVFRVRGYVKVDRAVIGSVGLPLVDQGLDPGHHLGDEFGGPGQVVGRQNIEGCQVLLELGAVAPG